MPHSRLSPGCGVVVEFASVMRSGHRCVSSHPTLASTRLPWIGSGRPPPSRRESDDHAALTRSNRFSLLCATGHRVWAPVSGSSGLTPSPVSSLASACMAARPGVSHVGRFAPVTPAWVPVLRQGQRAHCVSRRCWPECPPLRPIPVSYSLVSPVRLSTAGEVKISAFPLPVNTH